MGANKRVEQRVIQYKNLSDPEKAVVGWGGGGRERAWL